MKILLMMMIATMVFTSFFLVAFGESQQESPNEEKERGESISSKMTILLEKRDTEIDNWDTEELKHMENIKIANKQQQDDLYVERYNNKENIRYSKGIGEYHGGGGGGPVTLNELISSGIGMLVNHRISGYRDPIEKKSIRNDIMQRHSNGERYKGNVDKNIKVDHNRHQERIPDYSIHYSSSSVPYNGGYHDYYDSDSDSSQGTFILFLIALFPALIGLIILISFFVIVLSEVMKRTHPSWNYAKSTNSDNVSQDGPGEEGSLFLLASSSSSNGIGEFYNELSSEPVVRKKIQQQQQKYATNKPQIKSIGNGIGDGGRHRPSQLHQINNFSMMDRMPGNKRHNGHRNGVTMITRTKERNRNINTNLHKRLEQSRMI